MKKIFSIVLALVLVVGVGVVTAPPALADTIIDVPGDYDTIQKAIDAASSGDTIMVAAGEYEAFGVEGKANISIIGTEETTVVAADWVSIERGPIGDAWSMAAVKDSQNIKIQGIDFDGVALLDGAALSELESYREVVVGIAYVDSTGRIADLAVENITGAELGVGVAIIGDVGTSVVNLAGVTVKNSMAGVIIWDAEANLDGCTITGMQPNGGFGIMDSGVGILIGIPGEMWRGPSTVEMKGCTISDNNDVGIYVCDDSILEAHFNNIVGNTALGILNDGGQRVDAANNWWGDASGPFHPTENLIGTGNAVSSDVDFEPWVGVRVVTQTVKDNVVNAKAEADTEVVVTGTATVTVTKYTENPGGDAPEDFVPLEKYVDVYIPDTDEVSEIEIRLYYTGAEVGDISETYQKYFRLLWWNGTKWVVCSERGVNTTLGYIWARITPDTTPSLEELKGSPFGGYHPQNNSGVCFIATATYGTDTATEIDILREFRDAVLLPNSLGVRFVSLYYGTSPPMADFISRYEVLRTVLRVGFVDPVVAVLTWSQDLWLGTSS